MIVYNVQYLLVALVSINLDNGLFSILNIANTLQVLLITSKKTLLLIRTHFFMVV